MPNKNKVLELSNRFNENLKKVEGDIPEELIKAAPRVSQVNFFFYY